MSMNRRTFVIKSAVVSSALAVGALHNAAQAQAMVAETDPQAKSLGYVADATKADKAKFPKYAAGQHCGNCALYQPKDAKAGGCPLFAGKQVANAGWCSAWAKKG
ncbi:MAG: iron permease [Betaproteobacteria bacterium]|nr:iron permease [Betaproteobacteria bacterium]